MLTTLALRKVATAKSVDIANTLASAIIDCLR